MIHEVSGDILLTKAQAIAHGVAPHDHFANGLAVALRERWPAMVKDFRHYCRQENPKPGELWMWGSAGVRIFNLLTQTPAPAEGAHPGRASSDNVRHALKHLRQSIETENIQSLALPRLATGLGGLDWKIVRPMIEEYLGDLEIPVYLYTTFHHGVAAVEPVPANKPKGK